MQERTQNPAWKIGHEIRTTHRAKIADLEKKTPYTTAPWWVSPHTTIHPNRDKAVKHHNKTPTKLNALHQILFYTDGSGKDWHSSGHPLYEPHFSSLSWSIPPLYCLRCGVSRDSSYPFDGKRPPLAKNPDCYPHGQAAIRAIQGPGRQSGRSILINIIEAIDALRTAKRATGWRNKRKSNSKMEETDTGPKACFASPLCKETGKRRAHTGRMGRRLDNGNARP